MAVVDPLRLARSVSELVRIPSVNPAHAGPKAGEPGERALALHLADRLAGLGGEVDVQDVEDGRPNVYACFPGRSDRLAVLDVHTDTVTVEHMTDDPFDGRLEDDRVWGRGSVDTKASLGVALTLLEHWRAEGRRPEPTLLVVGTIGEEAGGQPGAIAFRAWGDGRGLEPDQLVVSEPTSCCPIYGHKGGVGFEVTVHGEAAHSSTPHLGRNAIVAASRAVVALEAEHQRLQTLPAPTEVGNGSITVGLIAGGTGGNVVPDRCTFTIGRRTVPFEDPADIATGLVALIEAAMPPCTVTLEPTLGSAAFYQSPDSDLIRLLASSCDSKATTAPYGTNALRYLDWAREMAVFGPGSIDQAHKATEWVTIEELVRCARGFEAWLRPA